MRTLIVRENMSIVLGRQGENEALRVVWPGIVTDWAALYGEGVFQLAVKRPGDTLPYPVTVTTEGGDLAWVPTNADTAASSTGLLELTYTVGGRVAKSRTWSTRVYPSLTGEGETDPPEPYQSWLDKILATASAAQAAQGKAEDAQAAAKASAEAALASETAAKNSETAAKLSEENAAASETAAEDAEAAAAGAALSEGNAAGYAQDASGSAASAGESASAAQTAQTGAETAKSSAETAAATATEKATAAAGSADDCEAAQRDIQDSIDGVAQESTAQTVSENVAQILTLLQQIVERGGGLNSFTLNLGENDEVILSYTDPEDETITDSVTLPTNVTGAAIVSEYAGIAAALAEIAGKETTT